MKKHPFLPPLLLLGSFTPSLAYYIDPSCDIACGKVESAMAEAQDVFSYASLVARYCISMLSVPAGDPNRDHDFDVVCENLRDTNLFGDFFGAERTVDAQNAMFARIADAFEDAQSATGYLSTAPDGKLTIVCKDDHLIRRSDSGWRDPDRGAHRIIVEPAIPPGQRPCDLNEALIYYGTAEHGAVIMVCANEEKRWGLVKAATFGMYNKRNVHNMEVDRMALSSLSTVFIHELIHAGNMQQFPRMLGDGQWEEYRYENCKNLAQRDAERGTDYRFRNCDSFAIIAYTMYMNNYSVADGKFRVWSKSRRMRQDLSNPVDIPDSD